MFDEVFTNIDHVLFKDPDVRLSSTKSSRPRGSFSCGRRLKKSRATSPLLGPNEYRESAFMLRSIVFEGTHVAFDGTQNICTELLETVSQ